VHATLFFLTILTTTIVGSTHYAGFLLDFVPKDLKISSWALLVRGGWYSGTILAILGTHELGHYLTCRYYDVDASMPYFLPAPILLTGTLGAFIRIRAPIPSKRVLFDIGIAGPLAGFAVAVPALFIGLYLSRVVPIPANFTGYSLGEPLLFKAASWLMWGTPPAGYALNMHPMGFAAWLGLFATALNLLPVLQLDGGHIAYAVLGRRSTIITIACMLAACGLIYLSTTWMVWAGLMLLMIIRFGPRHPPTLDEDVPLDATRLWLAFAALIILVLCFTPVPIESLEQLKP
jgi:membrane-associated protease RseP (regulator of RpoE activity)